MLLDTVNGLAEPPALHGVMDKRGGNDPDVMDVMSFRDFSNILDIKKADSHWIGWNSFAFLATILPTC